jgi:hypothetical protein
VPVQVGEGFLSSRYYRVRLFNFTFAALLYNLWRLTDFLVKVGIGREIRSPPVVTARTFVRAVGRSERVGGGYDYPCARLRQVAGLASCA